MQKYKGLLIFPFLKVLKRVRGMCKNCVTDFKFRKNFSLGKKTLPGFLSSPSKS